MKLSYFVPLAILILAIAFILYGPRVQSRLGFQAAYIENGYYTETYDGVKIVYKVARVSEIDEGNAQIARDKIWRLKGGLELVSRYSPGDYALFLQVDEVGIYPGRSMPTGTSAGAFSAERNEIMVADWPSEFSLGNCDPATWFTIDRAKIFVHELCHSRQHREGMAANEEECYAADDAFEKRVVAAECSPTP